MILLKVPKFAPDDGVAEAHDFVGNGVPRLICLRERNLLWLCFYAKQGERCYVFLSWMFMFGRCMCGVLTL